MKYAVKFVYLFLFLSVVSCSNNLKPSSNDQGNVSDNENVNKVFNLVNEERSKAGLGSLTYDSKMSDVANVRAKEIVTKFDHYRPDGSLYLTVFDEFNISHVFSGENIASGYRNADEVMAGWMSSSGHKANILHNKAGRIGIGVYDDNGTLYWVQLFAN